MKVADLLRGEWRQWERRLGLVTPRALFVLRGKTASYQTLTGEILSPRTKKAAFSTSGKQVQGA